MQYWADMVNGKKSKSLDLTIVVLARNAQDTLEKTLQSAHFVKEILVVDDESTDKTIDISLKHKARILTLKGNFAEKRTIVLEHVKTTWVFYLDADEVIDEKLKQSITQTIVAGVGGVYLVTRFNYFLGKRMYNDQVERLFAKKVLKGWTGKVHESPITTIKEKVVLAGHLDHYTHRNISDMLAKTNEWSEIEASLRFEANHPSVVWWRILRIGLTEAWNQFGKKRVWRYGREGLFEGYFQIVDKIIVYTKLWALQHTKAKTSQDIDQ
jgi:glycosyltransferase involved in cell wall biosynthesis